MADIQKVIASAFSAADEGNKGYLTKEDYKVAVINLSGYKPSKYEVDTAWRGARQGEGLTLSQFVELMLPRLKEKDISEEIRKIFMAFDRFCHGFISLEDCIAAFNKVVPHVPNERVETFFREIDGDNDGRVSFRDFELMFKQIII